MSWREVRTVAAPPLREISVVFEDHRMETATVVRPATSVRLSDSNLNGGLTKMSPPTLRVSVRTSRVTRLRNGVCWR